MPVVILMNFAVSRNGELSRGLVLLFVLGLLACSNLRQRSDFSTSGGSAGSLSTGGAGGISIDSGMSGSSGGSNSTAGASGGPVDSSVDQLSAGDDGSDDPAPAPVCGNGIQESGEACDRGVNNGLTAGACNPACTGIIVQKAIRLLQMNASIPTNGIIRKPWDLFCSAVFGSTYKALLVDGVTRVASQTPLLGDGQVDWVLSPYTSYANSNGTEVWVTDQVALLGVRSGTSGSLKAPLDEGSVDAGTDLVWVGINPDWTSSASNCSGWTASSAQGTADQIGRLTFIPVAVDCSQLHSLLCVEQ